MEDRLPPRAWLKAEGPPGDRRPFLSEQVHAYVDGLNLYYRALKPHAGLRWLDLAAFLGHFLLPQEELARVHYYTAPVSGLKDAGAPIRQQAYIRALRSLECVEVHYGNFMRKQLCRPLVHRIPLIHPPPDDDQYVLVHSSEEKGSDVNLAAHLIRDAFQAKWHSALVVSADTDLVEPIRIVTRELGKVVGVIHPGIAQQVPPKLREVASFVRHVTQAELRQSQFPDVVETGRGKRIRRPERWV